MLKTKLNKTYHRSSSHSSHTQTFHKIPFRTITKTRNNSIVTQQLYEKTPMQTQIYKKQSKMSQSQIIENNQVNDKKKKESEQTISDIKEYVKNMGDKKEEIESSPPQRKVSNADRIIRKSSKSIIGGQIGGLKTIEELERKIEIMLEQNIERFHKQKSKVGITSYNETSPSLLFEKDLTEVIQEYNELKLTLDTEHEDRLEEINRRIEVLEKMIAAQTLEADLLRGQYSKWKDQRGNTTSFMGRSMSRQKQADCYNYKQAAKIYRKIYSEDKKSKAIVGKYYSTSQSTYKKPSKESYQIVKEKKKFIEPNRQPMPRSDYSAQYLNYGVVSNFTCKPHDNEMIPETTVGCKESTYQQQFRQKHNLTNKVNFKDLDCYKNKFINTNISFMNASKKGYFDSLTSIKQKKLQINKENKAEDKNKQGSLIGSLSMSMSTPFFKTEHQKEFNWQNTIISLDKGENMIKSEIKDKKLDKLKNAFKALAMRR